MRRIFLLFLTVVLLNTSLGCETMEKKKIKILENQIVTTDKSYDFNKMERDLIALKDRYGDGMDFYTIGKSVEGRPIYGVKMGNGEHKLLIMASIHGREWMTSYLTMGLLELYLNYKKEGKKLEGYNISELLNETALYFVPMLNPDGVDLVLNGVGNRDREKYLLMNDNSDEFGRWKANIEGTDLNRQFNAHWNDTESKEEPSFENYKGKNFLDQPESMAIAEFTRRENFDIVVAYHLSGSVIFWYYNQKDKQYKRDLKIAKKISKLTKYKLVTEEDSDDVAAGYKDWFIKEFEKPGYTIEIGDKKFDQITVNDIDQFILENREVILYLAKEARKIEK